MEEVCLDAGKRGASGVWLPSAAGPIPFGSRTKRIFIARARQRRDPLFEADGIGECRLIGAIGIGNDDLARTSSLGANFVNQPRFLMYTTSKPPDRQCQMKLPVNPSRDLYT